VFVFSVISNFWFFLETLRLYTVLPVLNRECLEDYEVPGHPKYVIKKGMPVLIPCGAMHRDEKLYANPNTFNPDNFSPERVKERDSVEWLPFGDGPRNCIGMRFGQMQARIGLALLIKDFKFSVCEKTTIPMTYNKEMFLIASNSGIYLKAERVWCLFNKPFITHIEYSLFGLRLLRNWASINT